MKNMTLISFFFCFTHFLFSQECKIPKSIQKENFKILFSKKIAKIGEPYTLSIPIKAPSKGRDVNGLDFVNCHQFIPNMGNVVEIQIKKIKNLPKGIQWFSSKENQVFGKGETGCVFLFGSPEEKGKFALTIETQSKGRFLGITKSVDCEISGFSLMVE